MLLYATKLPLCQQPALTLSILIHILSSANEVLLQVTAQIHASKIQAETKRERLRLDVMFWPVLRWLPQTRLG